MASKLVMNSKQEQEDYLRGQRIAQKLQMNEDVSLDEACSVFWFEGSEKEAVIDFRHQMFHLRSKLQKYSKWKDMFVACKQSIV
jgi:hypothetical protein